MSVLVWIKSKKAFLKIQEGTGDNLSREDRLEGYVDYVLWSTFRPSEIDIDEELEMKLLDGGILMCKEITTADETLPDCYEYACGAPFDDNDVIVLMHEEDCEDSVVATDKK